MDFCQVWMERDDNMWLKEPRGPIILVLQSAASLLCSSVIRPVSAMNNYSDQPTSTAENCYW